MDQFPVFIHSPSSHGQTAYGSAMTHFFRLTSTMIEVPLLDKILRRIQHRVDVSGITRNSNSSVPLTFNPQNLYKLKSMWYVLMSSIAKGFRVCWGKDNKIFFFIFFSASQSNFQALDGIPIGSSQWVLQIESPFLSNSSINQRFPFHCKLGRGRCLDFLAVNIHDADLIRHS